MWVPGGVWAHHQAKGYEVAVLCVWTVLMCRVCADVADVQSVCRCACSSSL